jgi:cyclophilin family peptidyl-prolyl cis-trans isomerase
VQPGTYSLTANIGGNFVGGEAVAGNLGGTVSSNTITTFTVVQGQAAVNYNIAGRGIGAQLVSLRDFLATPAPDSTIFGTPGPGSIAVDNSVQPSTPATPGSASLAGVVQSASGGVPGVTLALTGIDSAGKAILLTTTTDATGAYQFASLQGGDYTINVTGQPSGFRADLPTVGSAGGNIFRNDQITNINLGASTSGNGYNFNEIPVAAPGAGALAITASLADDTAGPGGTTSDGLTSDATIQGSIASASPVTAFSAGLDGTPQVSTLGNLTPTGTFLLNPGRLAEIAGGTLTNGAHTLHLLASNADGKTATFDISFTLNATPPTQPTLQLSSADALGGNSNTTVNAAVTLVGQTSPGVQVQLFQGSTLLGTTTADTTGAYTFGGVSLQQGANNYTVQAADSAGNLSQLETFFIRQSGPVATASAPVAKNIAVGSADQFVDLSDPTFFIDGDIANSTIQFNTLAGPIDVQLLDTQAPQTVANFFQYIDQAAYVNDIFHRLSTSFVLQGGGFTFNPAGPTVNSLTTGPSVPNEFDNTNRPNVEGTLAMAKLGSDPNSATSQSFFNLVDNTQTLGVTNNGGFTVFGRLVSGADQRVLNTLINASVVDQSAFNSAFNTLPMNNYTGTNFPTDTTASNYDLITSVQILKQTEQLSYSIQSNTDTTGSIVQASITFGQLKLHAVGDGTATIVVKATDRVGATATVTFTVTVTG